MTDYTPSDAAKNYAHFDGTDLKDHDWSNCLRAQNFDAGVAHERARRPRVITTAAEYAERITRGTDAHWDQESVRWAITNAFNDGQYAATDEPTPILLTDPDDPRIRDGARERWVFSDGSAVEGAIVMKDFGACIRYADGYRSFSIGSCTPAARFLLAEAPDPDADVIVRGLAEPARRGTAQFGS